MRLSIFVILAFSAMALTGAAWAEDKAPVKEAPAAESAPAEQPAPPPPSNPMGAGLVVPSGDEGFAILETEKVPVYAQPSLEAEQVGLLQIGGNDDLPFQSYNVVREEKDPKWKPGFIAKLLGKKAPVKKTVKPVSEFMLSPT